MLNTGTEPTIVSAYQAWVALVIWVVVMLLHGLFRSFLRPDPDPIRSAGPLADE